jgi:peptide/nickel transport system ATP-binding protein/oligopeptide transport system ATP-binding protein
MAAGADPLVTARGLRKSFALPRRGLTPGGRLVAVAGVDLTVERGETLGLVGESGSGKSTLGRLLMRLLRADEGQVVFDGHELSALDRGDVRRLRPRMQIVFQDPYASLNPRMRVAQLVAFNLRAQDLPKHEVRARVNEATRLVGLGTEILDRFPHQLSGGQAQRVGIARAMVSGPNFIVADEPVSALDVSIQAEILNLIIDLRERLELATLFISHNLNVVRYVSDRIAVMYKGRIVELAPSRALYESPRHPYTRLLLSAIPSSSRPVSRAGDERERRTLREQVARLDHDLPLTEVAARHFAAIEGPDART